MTLSGKSLFASTLLHGSLVAVMAGVVLYPALKMIDAPANSEDSGAGWSLVIEQPAEAAESPSAEIAPEITPPIRIATPTVLATPLLPTTDIVTTTAMGALPTIAAAPSFAMKPHAKAGRKRGAGIGAGSGNRSAAYTPARYLSTPRPSFPATAKSAHIGGTVILSVSLDDSGHPTAVAVRKSSGHPELDEAALRAVRAWRFHPAKLDERPVPTRLEVPVRFALS